MIKQENTDNTRHRHLESDGSNGQWIRPQDHQTRNRQSCRRIILPVEYHCQHHKNLHDAGPDNGRCESRQRREQDHQRDSHSCSQHPAVTKYRQDHSEKDRNMQTGNRNDMADAANLKGSLGFIVQAGAITQKQRLDKAHNILRKQYLHPRQHIMPCSYRKIFQRIRGIRFNENIPSLISQKKDPLAVVVGKILFSAGCHPEQKRPLQLVPRRNCLVVIQIDFCLVFLSIQPQNAIYRNTPVCFVTIVRRFNGNRPHLTIQIPGFFQIFRMESPKPAQANGKAQKKDCHRSDLTEFSAQKKKDDGQRQRNPKCRTHIHPVPCVSTYATGKTKANGKPHHNSQSCLPP